MRKTVTVFSFLTWLRRTLEAWLSLKKTNPDGGSSLLKGLSVNVPRTVNGKSSSFLPNPYFAKNKGQNTQVMYHPLNSSRHGVTAPSHPPASSCFQDIAVGLLVTEFKIFPISCLWIRQKLDLGVYLQCCWEHFYFVLVLYLVLAKSLLL